MPLVEQARISFELRKRWLNDAAIGALGVAFFDLLFGLVMVVSEITLMVTDKTWYPYLMPSNQTNLDFLQFSQRMFNLGISIGSICTLICAFTLLVGIVTKNGSLVNFWYCPNAIFLVGHTALVLVASGIKSWIPFTPVLALPGLRIFSVLLIYKFQKALAAYKSDRLKLSQQARQTQNSPHPLGSIHSQQKDSTERLNDTVFSAPAEPKLGRQEFETGKDGLSYDENDIGRKAFLDESSQVFHSHYSAFAKQV